MIVRDRIRMLKDLCRAEKRCGMYLRFLEPADSDDPLGEVLKAAPYLDRKEHARILSDGFGYVFFDTVEEMRQKFERTVGPDGPTEQNPYRGPAQVYALACDGDGEILGDNTESAP